MRETDDPIEADDDALVEAGGLRRVTLAEGEASGRLDKALTAKLPELSRARLQALMAEGRVSSAGMALRDPAVRPAAGLYEILIPPPLAAEPLAEPIPLEVLYEDQHLIVVVKPAGMAAHPAPGSETGTLVNALLAHCGASLSGIGGVARPGIVHRLDKGTSGVMVAAKTDAAHRGLAALFAAHDIERVYTAFTRGAPKEAAASVRGRIGRSPYDRRKMAVVSRGGREAVTHYRLERRFGPETHPLAARLACRLETGRTHQIRAHLAHLGIPCLGDPLYGSGGPAAPVREAMRAAGLERQALHAAVLGFTHPITGEALRFEAPLPADLADLERRLQLL
ncbi:MAG: RluA family pseudouridine synthase [Caulobacteraceae bacterium]|nr:RluA family pseudouridine synthase [Caulobacteraceae bacterium]